MTSSELATMVAAGFPAFWDTDLDPDLAADMRNRLSRIRKMQCDASLAGATLSDESSLTAEHLGKIPGRWAHGHCKALQCDNCLRCAGNCNAPRSQLISRPSGAARIEFGARFRESCPGC